MKKSNQTQAEKVEQFVQKVQESETQKAQDNAPKSEEEQEAESEAFFEAAWKALPQTDQYLISLVNHMQEWARMGVSCLSSHGKEYVNARYDYLKQKEKA